MGWVRRRRTAGGGGRAGEKRRRKISPMVIDYLPRIPRIPYSDRPHGPKIEPSITGAPLSFLSLSLCLLLVVLLLLFRLLLSLSPSSFSSSTRLAQPTLSGDSAESVPSSIFSHRATKDVLPSLGNVALIKRARRFGTCAIGAHLYLRLSRVALSCSVSP